MFRVWLMVRQSMTHAAAPRDWDEPGLKGIPRKCALTGSVHGRGRAPGLIRPDLKRMQTLTDIGVSTNGHFAPQAADQRCRLGERLNSEIFINDRIPIYGRTSGRPASTVSVTSKRKIR